MPASEVPSTPGRSGTAASRGPPRRNSSGSDNCSAPATCRTRAARGHRRSESPSPAGARLPAPTRRRPHRRLRAAAAPTARTGSNDQGGRHKTGSSPAAGTAAPAGTRNGPATPPPGRPCPRRWRTRRTPAPGPAPPGRGARRTGRRRSGAGSRHSSPAGRAGEDADVVVRAGVDAIEAEGAVHVADLARLEQVQLAAGNAVAAADAILGPAARRTRPGRGPSPPAARPATARS